MSPLVAAARYNARWCDAVCAAQGSPGELRADVWLNRAEVPRFYPNLATLTAGADVAAPLDTLDAAGLEGEWGVKDSFARLDLRARGFRVLFEARWMRRPAAAAPAGGGHAAARWERVRTAGALAEWDAAWAGGADLPRVFAPDLLADPGVVLLAGRRDGRIVAGVATKRSDGVVGVSNFFARAAAREALRAAAVDAVRAVHPGLALVGYERGPDLAAARGLGFEAIGALRIWTKRRA